MAIESDVEPDYSMMEGYSPMGKPLLEENLAGIGGNPTTLSWSAAK
jgi:hypothetical protein